MPESHTSTVQWQGFEVRMRHRRAGRCLVRASAALDADVPEIAQQLLEEARALDPRHPELQEVEGRLLAASSPCPSPRTPNGRLSEDLSSRELFLLLVAGLALVWAAVSIDSADMKMLLTHLLTIAGSATIHVWPSV